MMTKEFDKNDFRVSKTLEEAESRGYTSEQLKKLVEDGKLYKGKMDRTDGEVEIYTAPHVKRRDFSRWNTERNS